ncbi:hypothetical protein C2845_PM14G07030 [Panicum miliaceum]|uniref:Uncharacterized protein n=1 Tax=Panicum miliaceum TaxID=4540 RepID=A0A3L6PLI9_PANMI|nr:hypothetical protein C2845_PM14G07030 [Panicum miliaceum]
MILLHKSIPAAASLFPSARSSAVRPRAPPVARASEIAPSDFARPSPAHEQHRRLRLHLSKEPHLCSTHLIWQEQHQSLLLPSIQMCPSSLDLFSSTWTVSRDLGRRVLPEPAVSEHI